MTFTECKTRLAALGYGLKRNARDCMGKTWPLCRFPMGAGATVYFQSIPEVDKNIRQIEQIREWESEMPEIGE